MPRITRSFIRERAPLLTDEIEDHSTNLSALYAERMRLWRKAADVFGMKHAEIAALFGVKTVTVSVALSKDAKR